MFYGSASTFITGVSAVVKWISHYVLPRTLSPILFPNKGGSVWVEMKICILFINNNGALVASLRKRKKKKKRKETKSRFPPPPPRSVSPPDCGAHSEGGARRLTSLYKHSNRMRSFFQDAHTALTLTLHITESGREKEMPVSPSSLGTSHRLDPSSCGFFRWGAGTATFLQLPHKALDEYCAFSFYVAFKLFGMRYSCCPHVVLTNYHT